MKVLVIEDDAETAAYVMRSLREHGHHVRDVTSCIIGRDWLTCLIAIPLLSLPAMLAMGAGVRARGAGFSGPRPYPELREVR